MTPDEQALRDLAVLLDTTPEYLRHKRVHRLLERLALDAVLADYLGGVDSRAGLEWDGALTPAVRTVLVPERG